MMLPPIPAKRYFTIGEVSELCGVKPYVLRYWEQEFTQLKPMKRRGNRRYYQHHEVLLIRRIRELLYEQGFTISGARNRLSETTSSRVRVRKAGADSGGEVMDGLDGQADRLSDEPTEEPEDELTNQLMEGLVTGLVDSVAAAKLAISHESSGATLRAGSPVVRAALSVPQIRAELLSIRRLLSI